MLHNIVNWGGGGWGGGNRSSNKMLKFLIFFLEGKTTWWLINFGTVCLTNKLRIGRSAKSAVIGILE